MKIERCVNKVIIGITMYNCSNQIEKVYNSLSQFMLKFDSRKFSIEKIIFLDNHSTDNTLEKIKEIVQADPLYCVCQNTENYGLGGSHKSLFLYAKSIQAQHVAIVHGDNQAEAQELTAFFDLAEQNNCCTVLGARFMDLKYLIGYSYLRIFGNCILNLLYSIALRQKVYDLGSGLNLFNISQLDFDRVLLFDDEFTFNMDLLIYILSHKIKYQYIPITWRSDDEVSNIKVLNVGRKALLKILKWSIFQENIWQGVAKKYIFNFI